MESVMFRIMNLKGLDLLDQEIQQIQDPTEREARSELIERIMEAVTDYDVHVQNYAYRKIVEQIVARGVRLEPVDRQAVVREWDERFDCLVTQAQKNAALHYTDQFRWHLFSFELLPAISGDAARAEFDAEKKQDLYLFFDYSDNAYLVRNAHLLTAEDVDTLRSCSPLELSDMYFFDPLNHWTYVKPHEEYCGPYYFKSDR